MNEFKIQNAKFKTPKCIGVRIPFFILNFEFLIHDS